MRKLTINTTPYPSALRWWVFSFLAIVLLATACRTARPVLPAPTTTFQPLTEDRLPVNPGFLTVLEKKVSGTNTLTRYQYAYVDPFTLDTVIIAETFTWPVREVWIYQNVLTFIVTSPTGTTIELLTYPRLHPEQRKRWEGYTFLQTNKKDRWYKNSRSDLLFFVDQNIPHRAEAPIMVYEARTGSARSVGKTLIGINTQGGIDNYAEIDTRSRQLVLDGRERFAF